MPFFSDRIALMALSVQGKTNNESCQSNDVLQNDSYLVAVVGFDEPREGSLWKKTQHSTTL
jgi:hypothetical protein